MLPSERCKMAGNMVKVGKLLVKNTALFLCDMQEKFQPTIKYFDEIVQNSNRLLRAAKLLDIPTVCTEQYPKGLGPTVSELGIKEHGITPIPKTLFSMVVPEVVQFLRDNPEVNTIILCGIETHACIQCTTMDFLQKGYEVHVVVDACSSRSLVDRMYAFDRMKGIGAYLTTSESVILALAEGSHHPKFRELQKIIWDPAADTGLLK